MLLSFNSTSQDNPLLKVFMNNSNVIDEEDSVIDDEESDMGVQERPSIKVSGLLSDDKKHLKGHLKECVDYMAVPESVWFALRESSYEYDMELPLPIQDLN